MTVAVVGAGIAGAACARALASAGVDVTVLDRGRAPGGRMAVHEHAGRPVDVGASYFTARDPRFRQVVDGWLTRGLARPWTDAFAVAGPDGVAAAKPGPLRYGTPRGLRSLVVDLLDGLPVTLATEVAAVGPGPDVDGTAYDAVVLAMPDPQAARLLAPSLTAERAAVEGREWQPVIAVSAGWTSRAWADDLDGCFVEGSDVVGWIADDGRRRGDGAPVLVAHTTSPFAARYLDDPSAAVPAVLDAVRAVLGIPSAAAWSRAQRWSYARPAEPRDEPFHWGTARIGVCGDGWGSPRVETAYLSGLLLGERVARDLTSAGEPAARGPAPAGC